MLPASELVAQKLTDVIHSRHLLSTIMYGLEGCGLLSSQERFDTVGGPAVPPARDATKIAAAVTKATGFPSLQLITGSKEMKYLPTRENFENFLSSLIPYTATFDPALAGLIREVSNTHAPDLTVIQRWEDALGFAGMSLLFTILVSKCNMSLDLLNYFPKETITASNGLSILQMLCAATLRYTLHTLDMYVQKFLQPDSCSTAHNLRDCLVEHETRVQQLSSLGVLGDQQLFRILEIGTLKRLCAKLSVPMLMFSEREREQGVELDLQSIKAELMAYADKEFYDWQADKNAPKVGAVIGPASSPNPGKVAKQLAKAATKAAVAAAALSAGATTAAAIPMAPAMAHPSTLTTENCSSHLFLGACNIPGGRCLRQHPPAHAGAFASLCNTTINGVSKRVCWTFARKGHCFQQSTPTGCANEHVDIPVCKLPPGDRRVKVLGILNPSNNPLNTLKRASGRSHPSLDKSLIPKLQPTLIRDQPPVPVCASVSSVSSLSSSSVSSLSSSSVSSLSSSSSPLSYVSSLSSTPHITPIASVHPTSQSVGRIREPDRQPKPPTVGAVISDTGTETCIWGKEVKTRLYDVQPLSEPVRLQVASGAHIYVH